MSPSPQHVVLFTTHLGGGGAEKQLVRLANHLDRARFAPRVVVARGGGSYERELARDVPLHVLGAKSIARAALPLWRYLRRQPPALVFSIMDRANCTALLATRAWRSAPPVVIGEQIPITIELGRNKSFGQSLLRATIPMLYPHAAAVVALSHGVAEDLGRWLPEIAPRISVVHNVGVDETVLERAAQSPRVPPLYEGSPVLVACGRLTEQKGFIHLLRAFKTVRQRTGAKLWLLGDGPLRGELADEARRLGLAEAVWFAGFVDNPYAYMRRADVFVLSSLWEGFGNVLVEAMAVGAPVVASDCPFGPSEIIRDAREGLLVPPANEPALAAALLEVLTDEPKRRAMAAAGTLRAQDFSARSIASGYAEVFTRVLAEPRPVPRAEL